MSLLRRRATFAGCLANTGITLSQTGAGCHHLVLRTTSLAFRMKLMQSTPSDSHFLTARMMRRDRHRPCLGLLLVGRRSRRRAAQRRQEAERL